MPLELTPEKLNKLDMRESMLLKRHKLSKQEMRDAMIKVSEDVITIIKNKKRINCIGLYSAINKEIDMSFLAEMILSNGIKVALPRVVVKKEPLIFNRWDLTKLEDKDAEGIPCSMGEAITPDIVVVPLVAYNRKGHRLGYGSGYYDRTFNSSLKGCFAVGVGYAFQETEDLKAESHDVAMNVIITEKEIIHI